MGMKIDEARNMLMIIKNSTESLKTAIEIMRKYQKIQEIHKKYANTQYEYIGIQKIGEVLNDGNDD